MTVLIADVQKEYMADYIVSAIGTTGVLVFYAADGTVANHTGGIPDRPEDVTDATVLAAFEDLSGVATTVGNGRIDWTSGGSLSDSNANNTGTAAWARFMTATEFAKAEAARVGIVDCAVSTIAAGTGDILLNSTSIVAGGIVSLTQLYHNIS